MKSSGREDTLQRGLKGGVLGDRGRNTRVTGESVRQYGGHCVTTKGTHVDSRRHVLPVGPHESFTHYFSTCVTRRRFWELVVYVRSVNPSLPDPATSIKCFLCADGGTPSEEE